MAQIFKAPKRGRKGANKKGSKEQLQLTIESVDHKGMGVARHNGQVIFVEGALPEEVCEVSVTDTKHRFKQASVKRVLNPSSLRESPFCPHFTSCGGCQTQHASPGAMLELKQQAVNELITRKGLLETLPWQAPLQGEARSYRRKTRLAVDARDKNNVRVGFRQKHSKSVIHLEECEILDTDLQGLLRPTQELLASLNTPSAVGHINLSKGENLNQVCLRITKTLGQQDKEKFTHFAEQHNCQLVLEHNSGELEALSRKDEEIVYCPQEGIDIHFEANDFIQVNDVINQKMVNQAMDWLALEADDQVLDLFCGVGNFSLPLATRCKQVIGVEGVSKMVQRATDNAQRNGIQNAQFVVADLNDPKPLSGTNIADINKILLDPAREGASGTISLLKSIAASHILYVSCNPSTFVRDAEHILQQEFRLEKIGLMDMFPNTAHTELMALFVRT